MLRSLLRLARRVARLAAAAWALLSFVAAQRIEAPRAMETVTIADFIASNRTACGWTAA